MFILASVMSRRDNSSVGRCASRSPKTPAGVKARQNGANSVFQRPRRGQSSVGGDVSRVYPSPGRGDTRLRDCVPAAGAGACRTRLFRRGLREGLQRKCFWPETNCKSLSYNGVGANNYSPLRIWRAKNIAAESPTARRRTVTKRVVGTRHGTSLRSSLPQMPP